MLLMAVNYISYCKAAYNYLENTRKKIENLRKQKFSPKI